MARRGLGKFGSALYSEKTEARLKEGDWLATIDILRKETLTE